MTIIEEALYKKIKYAGLLHKKDAQLSSFLDSIPYDIQKTKEELIINRGRSMVFEADQSMQERIDEINVLGNIKRDEIRNEKDKEKLKQLVKEKTILANEIYLLQKYADAKSLVDTLEETKTRQEGKLSLVADEIQLRDDGALRNIIGTTYYMDFNCQSGTITGIWTFTNGSASVTAAADGNAVAELAVGDYIRQSDGTQWYKIDAIVDDDTLTLSIVFQQATHTDEDGASKYNDKDGTAIADAFCHLSQYITDTTRSAGDVLKVRANQTHVYSGLSTWIPDESGTLSAWIEIRGCDISDDPFSDSSDVKPIFDFNASSTRFRNNRMFWKYKNIDFYNATSDVNAYPKTGFIVEDCIFRIRLNWNSYGMSLEVKGGSCEIIGCKFYDNQGVGLRISTTPHIVIDSCTFNGGVTGDKTDDGIQLLNSIVYVKDCSFGQTTTHNRADIISWDFCSLAFVTNSLTVSDAMIIEDDSEGGTSKSVILCEDYNQVGGDHKAFFFNGKTGKETTIVRSGGADSSVKVEPNDNCSSIFKMGLGIPEMPTNGFKIWCPAAETTITIYMRSFGIWTAYPTNSELFIKASYLDHATSGSRAEAQSTQVLADETTWVAFTVTITPSQAGWVYVDLQLGKYEASKGCYVDIKPVIS